MKKCLFSFVSMYVALANFYDCEAADKVDGIKVDQVTTEESKSKSDSITNIETIKVGNDTINVKDFIGKLDSMFAQVKDAKNVSNAEKEAFYKSMINAKIAEVLFCNAARELGLDKDSVVKEQIDMTRNQILARAYMQKIAVGRITEQSILDEYKEYEKDFPKAGIELGNILVKDKATAEKVIRELNSGKKFADLAKEYSIAASKSNGGKENIVPIEGLPANMKVLAGLKDGEYVKEPIQSSAGFHIISVLSHQQVKAQPLNDVRKVIENVVLKKEMDKVIRTLLSTTTITAYDASGKNVDVIKLLENNTPLAEAKEQIKDTKASEVKSEAEAKEAKSKDQVVSSNDKSADLSKKDEKKNIDSGDDGFVTRVWNRVKNLF